MILECPKIRCYSLLEIFFSRTGLGTIIYFSIYALYSRLVFVHSYQTRKIASTISRISAFVTYTNRYFFHLPLPHAQLLSLSYLPYPPYPLNCLVFPVCEFCVS